MNMTTEEQIIAEALAQNAVTPLRRGGIYFHEKDGQGIGSTQVFQGAKFATCCAVGAGLAYRGAKPTTYGPLEGPMELYARTYGVPYDFAAGVSTGFEDQMLYDDTNEDFVRGYDVGLAIAQAVGLDT